MVAAVPPADFHDHRLRNTALTGWQAVRAGWPLDLATGDTRPSGLPRCSRKPSADRPPATTPSATSPARPRLHRRLTPPLRAGALPAPARTHHPEERSATVTSSGNTTMFEGGSAEAAWPEP